MRLTRTDDGGRSGLLIAALLVASLLLSGCAGYGGRTVGKDGADAVVRTDGEHCEMTLPEGWKWYPAKWAAESPKGTQLSFDEIALGRPQNPDWSELRDRTVDDVTRRNPNAQVTADDSEIRIDYGNDGGISVIQRFDRYACRLAFSNSQQTRTEEMPEWDAIIASLARISPTPDFTPPADD